MKDGTLRVIHLQPGDVFGWLDDSTRRAVFVAAKPVGEVRLRVTVTDEGGSNRRDLTVHRHTGVRVVTPRRD